MKHHSFGHSGVRKGDVQTFGCEVLDWNVLKSALLHLHVLNVPKLVLAHCVGELSKRLYGTDGAVAQE